MNGHTDSGTMKSLTYDVIIVGGGGSGLAAAAKAGQLGLSVLLLERQPKLGGTTGIAVGSFTANRTSLQAQRGIQDRLEDHSEDAGKFAPPEIEQRNSVDPRDYFLSQTAETFEWLRQLGLAFHGPSPEPPNRVPRMHNVVPNAQAYIAVLMSEALRHGAHIHCQATVMRLDSTSQPRSAGGGAGQEAGADVGRSAGESPNAASRVDRVVAMMEGGLRTFVARRGVILAAGDYANSPELIRRFKRFSIAESNHREPFRSPAMLIAAGYCSALSNLGSPPPKAAPLFRDP